MSLDEIIKQNRKDKRQGKFSTNRDQHSIKKEFNSQPQQQQKQKQQPKLRFNQKNQFPKQKFNKAIINGNNNNNNRRNNFPSDKQKYGMLSKSKTIRKNKNTFIGVANNNANGAIGNRGRNKQRQMNKFRQQRRLNSQNVTNSQIRAKFTNKSANATARPVIKRAQNAPFRVRKTGRVGAGGGILKLKVKQQQTHGILKSNKIKPNRFRKNLLAKKVSNPTTVRFRTALAKKKQILQQPQRKLIQNRAGVQLTVARKNLKKAKRLLNARKGPLQQTKKFTQNPSIKMKSTIRKSKFVVKKPATKLTSQLNSNLLRINIKNNQLLQKAAQRTQQPKSTKPVIKRSWKPSQSSAASNRKAF